MKLRRSRAAILVPLVALALVISACGSGESSVADVSTGARPNLPAAQAASSTDLPAVTVWNVGDSKWVQFADLLPAEKPLVLWFWAPHCPACAAEAPAVKKFAEDHANQLNVVGIGTQDDATMAAQFLKKHDLGFPMLWDEGFETWKAFGVTSQPTVAVLNKDGKLLDKWSGGISESKALRTLGLKN